MPHVTMQEMEQLQSESVRLEEFYAEKAALAVAYTGYKKQIDSLHEKSDDFKPLVALMDANLKSLSKSSYEILSGEPEKNIYDKIMNKLDHVVGHTKDDK